MSQHRNRITEQATELLADVERSLAEGDARLRAMGLDPAKVRAFGQTLNPSQQRELDAAMRADLEAIDQEVAEEKARLAAAAPGLKPSRRPQRFV